MFRFGLNLPFVKNWLKNYVRPKQTGEAFNCLGIRFKNQVGLAAGFDKNAAYLNEMATLGFGFIEIGTVTPLAQKGNDKPRLFRLKKDKALINRMGFNNGGLETVVENLKKVNLDIVIGGNLGKNKITPNEQAVDDYVKGFEAMYPYVDYFVINVSSPNTPGLRELQDRKPLKAIIEAVQQCNTKKAYPKPVLLKIAPDLNQHQLNDIIELVNELKLPGIIATNTTIERKGLITNHVKVKKTGNGGLSGLPVLKKSNEVLSYLRNNLPKEVVLFGVGGISDTYSAKEKLNLGADLIQIYSGLIFYGPTLVKDILNFLIKKE